MNRELVGHGSPRFENGPKIEIPEIPAALSRLEERTMAVLDAIARLENQLSPVLASAPPEGEQCTRPAAATPMGNSLEGLIDSANREAEMLASILRRLQL